MMNWPVRSMTKINGDFNPKAFLASLGEGRSITTPSEGQVIFSQGDRADALSTSGKDQGHHALHSRQAVVAILGAGDFFGEDVSRGSRFGSRPPLR